MNALEWRPEVQLKERYNGQIGMFDEDHVSVDTLKPEEPAFACPSGKHSSAQATGNVTVSSRGTTSRIPIPGMLAATAGISFRASAMTTAKPLERS
jgi:hypothetical protein